MEEYMVPELARVVHRVPHLNFSLHTVSAQFNLSSSSYTESLLVIGSVPSLWLIFTLLLLLVYLLTRCCCERHKQRHPFVGLKWSLGFTAVITCLVIAAGFYGNHALHEGVTEFADATEYIAKAFDDARNQTSVVESTLVHDVGGNSRKLQDLFLSDSKPSNASIVAWLDQKMSLLDLNVSESVGAVRTLAVRLQNVQKDALPVYVRLTETIRWPAMMVLLGLFALSCVALLVGVVRHSRCLLIFFSVAALLAVILCFLLSSVHSAITVGLADFCIWPDLTVRSMVAPQFPADMSDPALSYYLNCTRPRTSPWQRDLTSGQRRAAQLAQATDQVYSVAVKYYPSQQLEPTIRSLKLELNRTRQAYIIMDRVLECEHIHQKYILALNTLCGPVLMGLSLLVLALLTCGILFTLLAWCDSHAWIHIQKRRDYLRVETADPFLGSGGRRPPTVGGASGSAPPAGSLRSLRTSPHGSLLAARNHSTPPTLRTRTPPFPVASPPSGPLLAFNGRIVDDQRAGTLPLPRRYSPTPASAPPPPSYTAALMQMADHSDYDNYS